MFYKDIEDIREAAFPDPFCDRLRAHLGEFGSGFLPVRFRGEDFKRFLGSQSGVSPAIPETKRRRARLRRKCHAGSLLLAEGGYAVRPIVENTRLIEAYRLRHSVFSEELGWTRVAKDGLECDRYDKGAVMLGLYDNQRVIYGCIRIVPPFGKFMLEGEFSGLLGGLQNIYKTRFTAEVSRLCVSPAGRRRRISHGCGTMGLAQLLLKGLYRWCMKNGVKSVCAVVDNKAISLYRKWMLPLRVIGGPVVMDDGVRSYAVRLSWEDVWLAVYREYSGFLAWLLV